MIGSRLQSIDFCYNLTECDNFDGVKNLRVSVFRNIDAIALSWVEKVHRKFKKKKGPTTLSIIKK